MSLVNVIAASRSNCSWNLLNSPVVTILHECPQTSHEVTFLWVLLSISRRWPLEEQIILVQSAPCSGNRWEVAAVLTQNLQDLMCQVLQELFLYLHMCLGIRYFKLEISNTVCGRSVGQRSESSACGGCKRRRGASQAPGHLPEQRRAGCPAAGG